MVAYRARVREAQVNARAEAGCEPDPLTDGELADLEAIIAGVQRERIAMEARERAADREAIDEGLATGRPSWRYLDPEVESLRTITRDPWFLFDS